MRVEKFRLLARALDDGLHRNVVRLVAAQREERREERPLEGARVGEQSREHDVIVRTPLRAPVLAIEVVLADDPVEAVPDEIRLEVGELELTAVVERGVIAVVREIAGEPREPRRARGRAQNRRIGLRGPAAQDCGEPLLASIPRRIHRVEEHAAVRERVEVRRDVREPAKSLHDLCGATLPDDDDDIGLLHAEQMPGRTVRRV